MWRGKYIRFPRPCQRGDRMKVTHVSLMPTRAATEAGRPALTPELLAATGARTSRNNEGLEAILAKIDPADPDRSVDSIFRMIDYGHQSIADMAPVAMFMDGVSLWLAYFVWSVCPVAGGQESSTRYLRYTATAAAPEELGITEPGKLLSWREMAGRSFAAYREALEWWQNLAALRPEVLRLPRDLVEDPAEAAQKKVARMRRNYAFDRARYFLPVAARTNMMLVMPARAWVQLCQHLASHILPEPQALAAAICAELGLVAPRLVKHAEYKASFAGGMGAEFFQLRAEAEAGARFSEEAPEAQPFPSLFVDLPPVPLDARGALAHHDNRYAWIGESLRRTSVRFGWDAVAFAEIRDLNRHRTGTKHCPLVPRGFYGALDQVPGDVTHLRLRQLSRLGAWWALQAHRRLGDGDPGYIYWTHLGTQYPFEHLTTADKFLYEAELRTGVGSHYRYARHFHDLLALWYARFPETHGLVLEGSAEPE
jgi:thymidylate synthase ThyX